MSPKNPFLEFSHRFSHWIPRLSGAALLLISTITAFKLVAEQLEHSSGDVLLAKFLIGSFAFIAASMYAGSWLGKLTEGFIDRVVELSYIKLNRGDDRLLEKFKKSNKISSIGAIITFCLITIHAIACGVIGSYIYDKFI